MISQLSFSSLKNPQSPWSAEVAGPWNPESLNTAHSVLSWVEVNSDFTTFSNIHPIHMIMLLYVRWTPIYLKPNIISGQFTRYLSMIFWAYRFTMTILFFAIIVHTVHVFIALFSTDISLWCCEWTKNTPKGRLKSRGIHSVPIGTSKITKIWVGISRSRCNKLGISGCLWKQIGWREAWNNYSFQEFIDRTLSFFTSYDMAHLICSYDMTEMIERLS